MSKRPKSAITELTAEAVSIALTSATDGKIWYDCLAKLKAEDYSLGPVIIDDLRLLWRAWVSILVNRSSVNARAFAYESFFRVMRGADREKPKGHPAPWLGAGI